MPIYRPSAKLAALMASKKLPTNVVPQIIDAIGLSEENLGQRRFAQELVARREWCAEHCNKKFEVESIRDAQLRLVGRQFRFESLVDAVHFKLRWGATVLNSP